MPFAKGRWIDENNRSHEWSGNVASNDRNQIRSQIQSQTGAKEVILTGVSGSDSSEYNQRIKEHNRRENERRREQAERLRSSSAPVTYSSNHSLYSDNHSSSSDSSISGSSLIYLVTFFGAIWAFITLMPWVMMIALGSGGTWLAEKMVGQSVNDYNETKSPTDKQSQKALIVLAAAILLGGYGFVQGTAWQKNFNGSQSVPQQSK